MLKACIYFINKFILIIFYKKDSLKKKSIISLFKMSAFQS